MEELLLERYELAMERIAQIKEEHILPPDWDEYFAAVALFLEEVGKRRGVSEVADVEILYRNPTYAISIFGKEYGPLLSAVAEEMYSLVGLVQKGNTEEIVIRPELFVELYGTCVCEWQENERLPEYNILKEIVYWYVSDYSDITMERQFLEKQGARKGEESVKEEVLGILQNEEWLKQSFLWDKALAKRRREVEETFVARYG